MFTYIENDNSAKIKVIGVGGAGGNAINNMITSNLQGVKFIAANSPQHCVILESTIRQRYMFDISVGHDTYLLP